MTPFDLILHFLLVLNVVHLYVEFELSSFNRPQDIMGSKNSKSGSREPT